MRSPRWAPKFWLTNGISDIPSDIGTINASISMRSATPAAATASSPKRASIAVRIVAEIGVRIMLRIPGIEKLMIFLKDCMYAASGQRLKTSSLCL